MPSYKFSKTNIYHMIVINFLVFLPCNLIITNQFSNQSKMTGETTTHCVTHVKYQIIIIIFLLNYLFLSKSLLLCRF